MEQMQKLALQQTLSPQMRQSLQVLQVPLMELKGLAATEMMLNPILEEEPISESTEASLSEKELSSLESEWDTYYVQSTSSPEVQGQHEFLMNSLTETSTLQRFLNEQVGWMGLGQEDARIATLIVGNIDDAGYLEASVKEIAQLAGVDSVKVEDILHHIQTLEPAGVAARDLRECLLLQLKRQNKMKSLERQIIEFHLEKLGRRKLFDIARALQVPLAEVNQAVDRIAYLDPKPGRVFTNVPDSSLIPDIVVEQAEDGEYRVFLNNDDLPRLRINASYKQLLSQAESSSEVRDYIREKIREGRFFIRSIQQRQETILGIARQIVSRQHEFFENGNLRPMTMAQIAETIGLHETTVSRAVSNKYMATPQGVFEMKYFFTSGYQTTEGESVSNETVRKTILKLVNKEDPSEPWSDQEMAELLKERGLPIARRTVAKYREQLSILPSYLRKKCDSRNPIK